MKEAMNLLMMYSYLWMLLSFYSIHCEKVPVTRSYEPGENLVLYCTVKNVSEAIWMKDSREISIGRRVVFDPKRFSVDRAGSDYSLKIKGMLREDKGNLYTCKHRNGKEIYERYILKRMDSASISNDTYSGPFVRIMENETVSLWCNASGYPQPVVSWYVFETDSFQGEKITGLGINENMLGIRRVSRDCATKFQCQAVSTYRPDIVAKRNITLIVDFIPELSIKGIINKKTSSNTLHGNIADTVDLTCAVFSSTPLNVTWLRDNKEIGGYSSISGESKLSDIYEYGYSIKSDIDKKEKRVIKVMLTFNLDTETFSIYHCRAENKVGSSFKTIETRKIGKR